MTLPTDGIFVLPDPEADPAGPYTLEEARTRLADGRLDPAVALWSQSDAPEWRPAAELLPAVTATAAPFEPREVSFSTLTNIFAVCLCALALVMAFSCQTRRNDPRPTPASASARPATSAAEWRSASANIYPGVRLYYGPNKSFMGTVHTVRPASRGEPSLVVEMPDGRGGTSLEPKNRGFITNTCFVRADDPALP